MKPKLNFRGALSIEICLTKSSFNGCTGCSWLVYLLFYLPRPYFALYIYKRHQDIKTFELHALYPMPHSQYSMLFPSFQTAPVASWPNWVNQFQTPDFTMIAIDHLWLKSSQTGRRICERRSVEKPNGSDHKMVLTKIGY